MLLQLVYSSRAPAVLHKVKKESERERERMTYCAFFGIIHWPLQQIVISRNEKQNQILRKKI